MPWTPAHPAFALPFVPLFKKPFLKTALLFGAIAPDLPYFIFVKFIGWGHISPFCFIFGIPASLFLSFLWVKKIRSPLLNALPLKMITQQLEFRLTLSDVFLGIFAATLGIGTHIFADAFTHETGYFVQNFRFLEMELVLEQPLWHLLQYLGTAFGLLILLIYFWMDFSFLGWRATSHMKFFWLRVSVFSILSLIIITAFRWPFPHLSVMGVAGLSSFAWGILFASLSAPSFNSKKHSN